MGDAGETYYLTTTIRSYNAGLDRWELIGMEQGNGLQDFGTAQRDGNELRIEQTIRRRQRGTDSPANPLLRNRRGSLLMDERPVQGQRQTWVSDELRIEARRIGAPRSLDPLAAPRE